VEIFDFLLHVDSHLEQIIASYGTLTYAILFLIIFAETGLVFTPFLPGDSLLFATGMFAATGSFHVLLIAFVLWLAAFLGDNTNYWIGHFFGQKIIAHPKIPINQQHVDQTQAFYQQHGGKTVFLARFMPIIRTFAPFVAGIGKMDYHRYIFYSFSGAFVWMFGFVFAGYFFGNIPIVRENFSVVIMLIIVVSLLPAAFKGLQSYLRKKKTSQATS